MESETKKTNVAETTTGNASEGKKRVVNQFDAVLGKSTNDIWQTVSQNLRNEENGYKGCFVKNQRLILHCRIF